MDKLFLRYLSTGIMKYILIIFLFFLIVTLPQSGFSQKEVEIGGIKYVLHTVSKSETVFSLCQKYKVSQSDLEKANPGMTAVLRAGSEIKVPVGKVESAPAVKQAVKVTPVADEEFYYHKTAKRQTIFSIAKQYGITANDLIRFNPELTNGLQIGQILKIPVNSTKSDSGIVEESPDSQAETSEYKIHQVVSGETLFSLEQRYGITEEEMLKNNADLKAGLKTGMKLKIPVIRGKNEALTQPVDPQQFIKYRVEKGETLFSLANRFGVEVGELKKANPSLFMRGLEVGEILLIPKSPEKQTENFPTHENVTNLASVDSPPPSECFPLENTLQPTYKIGLLLPLYLLPNGNKDINLNVKDQLVSKITLENHTDSLKSDTTILTNGANIDQRALIFMEFYEGALLAIDSLQKRGMSVELEVFDASNQTQINSMIQLQEFRELNLIIGPVYPELQENVASFAAKNRIPMISPLSSAGNFEQNNSWYFKVNPTKDYQTEQTANYIASELANKNFFLLQQSGSSNSAEAKLASLSKQKLMAASGGRRLHEYNFQERGVNEIAPLMDPNGDNVFVIPTDNEAQVSVAVTNLTALAEHYNIVLMGTSALTKLKSIQTENYHRIRLRYLSPYFVDYQRPLVKRVVSSYRNIFSAEPTQFSLQGYDVTYYFLSALFRYGKDFRNCLTYYPMELTQMNFNFKKVAPMGGFLNHSLFVTSYERNFDVLNYGSFDGSNLDQQR